MEGVGVWVRMELDYGGESMGKRAREGRMLVSMCPCIVEIV
jgi:hypothetical protein